MENSQELVQVTVTREEWEKLQALLEMPLEDIGQVRAMVQWKVSVRNFVVALLGLAAAIDAVSHLVQFVESHVKP